MEKNKRVDIGEEDKSLDSGRQLLRASSKNLHGLWMFADPIAQSEKLNKSIRLSRIEDRSSSKNNSEDENELDEENFDEDIDREISSKSKLSATDNKKLESLDNKLITSENIHKNAIKVLITGSENTGKNVLFWRLVSEYCSIPFNAIWKDHQASNDPSEAHPKWYFDILISVLKGVIEDTHGGIKDDFKTPLPFLTINEDDITYHVYYPTGSDYNSRIKYTNPMVDIVLHLIDINIFNGLDSKDINILLEKQLNFVKQLKFKQLIIGVNKMETVAWSTSSFNILAEWINNTISKLHIKNWNNSEKIKDIMIIPLSSKKNSNIKLNYCQIDHYARKTGDSSTEGVLKPKLSLIQALNKAGLEIIRKEDTKLDKFILAVDFVFGKNFRGTMINRSAWTIDLKTTYMLIPKLTKIKIRQISNQPMTYKYKIVEDEKSNDDVDEEWKYESDEEEYKDYPIEASEPSEPSIKRGDLIVSWNPEGNPWINISERLMVEISICSSNSTTPMVITKGYQFDIHIHSFSGVATIESLDGLVKYTEEGEREFNKSQIKIAKSDEIFVGKIGISSPIGIDNFDSVPSISQFIWFKDGNYIGSGQVIKHVPI